MKQPVVLGLALMVVVQVFWTPQKVGVKCDGLLEFGLDDYLFGPNGLSLIYHWFNTSTRLERRSHQYYQIIRGLFGQ